MAVCELSYLTHENERTSCIALSHVLYIVLFLCISDAAIQLSREHCLNTFIPTLKPQSNGPLYSNTVIGTLATDGWAVTLGTCIVALTGACSVEINEDRRILTAATGSPRVCRFQRCTVVYKFTG